jgi:predicted permease
MGFWRDVQWGARGLWRTRALSGAMILVLALGIAACAAVFSVVDAVLLRPLPYEAPDRMVTVLHRGRNPVAPANYLDWRRDAKSFARMGAAELWSPSLTGGDKPERVPAVRVSADLLLLLGVAPTLGRLFVSDDEQPGRDRVAVLEYGFWQRRFAGNPAVVGRSITLDGEGYTVLGVMPRGFAFPPFWATGAEVWAPLALEERATDRQGSSLRVFARLRPDATLEQARAEIAGVTSRLEAEFPGTNREVMVRPLLDVVVGDVRPALLVLMGAVGFVLLIACANVAHMLLARAAARRKEMSMRAALGGSRWRLVRQLLIESLILAGAAGIAAVFLARACVQVMVALSPPGLPRMESVALDGAVLAFTGVVALACGVLFGLVPAVHSTRRDLIESLREGERGSTEGGGRGNIRGLLVGSELALALVLLVGAGLMIRTFLALQSVDPGFDPRNVASLQISVAGTSAGEPPRRAAFFQQLLREVGSMPGVEAAGAINHLPLAGDVWGWPFRVEGQPEPLPGDEPAATYRVVLPGYFRTMGIPILRGRDVASGDTLEAPGVVVVNETLAKRHWPGKEAVGQRIQMADEHPTWATVVGVAKDSVRGRWAAPPDNEVYLPYLQVRRYLETPSSHFAYMTLVVRTAGDPAAIVPGVRRIVWSHEPNAPISDVSTMADVVATATATPRFYLVLLGVFSAIALILAAVGIYAVISYSVARRTNEIGIRMALGAAPRDVLRLVVGQGMIVGVGGALAGLAGALALTRAMSSMLYGVGSDDPATFLAVLALLGTVSVVAAYWPARRATRIDPLEALRRE